MGNKVELRAEGKTYEEALVKAMNNYKFNTIRTNEQDKITLTIKGEKV